MLVKLTREIARDEKRGEVFDMVENGGIIIEGENEVKPGSSHLR